MAKIELRGIGKRYGREVVAVDSLDLTIQDGEFFTLLGPSGSGKTTLLRTISGLETADSGDILIDGLRVNRLAPRARNVAMVFQTPALYPYLSVFDNLAFPLRTQKVARSEIRARVEAVALPLGIEDLLKRSPRALSGGERQRVALGRAMIRRPSVYLLDEPFSNLDTPLRASLRASLTAFHQSAKATIILVTHDQGEALALSDRVGVMESGRLVQVGTPRELYETPTSRFVAGFLGNPPMNLISGRVQDGERPVDLGLRPEDLVLGFPSDPVPEGRSTLPNLGRLLRVEYLGNSRLAFVEMSPNLICARIDPSREIPPPGTLCSVSFDRSNAHYFDRESGHRIES